MKGANSLVTGSLGYHERSKGAFLKKIKIKNMY